MERKPCFGGSVSNPVKAPHKVQVPGLAAEFTVGNHLKAQVHLLFYQVTDGRIFYGFKLVTGDFPDSELGSCFLYCLRAEETANKVGTHRRLLYHTAFCVNIERKMDL